MRFSSSFSKFAVIAVLATVVSTVVATDAGGFDAVMAHPPPLELSAAIACRQRAPGRGEGEKSGQPDRTDHALVDVKFGFRALAPNHHSITTWTGSPRLH